mmetsp:Transcript_19403/g.45122  ORF Transcript_19403/g.45122 Transcript_19403/m.45122 type:complete len:630 (+) Transcript_19403:61-1950(+)
MQVPAQAYQTRSGVTSTLAAKVVHPAAGIRRGGSSAVAPVGRGMAMADSSWEQACSAAVLPSGASILAAAGDGDMRPRRSVRRSNSQVQHNSPSPPVNPSVIPAFAHGSGSILANATPAVPGPSRGSLPAPVPQQRQQSPPREHTQQNPATQNRQPLLQLGQPFKVQLVQPPVFRKTPASQLPPRWPIPQEQLPPTVNPEGGAPTWDQKAGGPWYARSSTPRHGFGGPPEGFVYKADEAGSPRAPSPVRYGRQCSPYLRRQQLSFQPVQRGQGGCRTPLPPRPSGGPPHSGRPDRCPATARPNVCTAEQQVSVGGASIVQDAPIPEDDDGSDEGVMLPNWSMDQYGLQLDPAEQITYDELEFLEHLGSGEFGQVCRGKYRGKEVAIKQLFWDNTSTGEVVLKDLAREIESFRHLRHKRLVQFIGACLEIPHPCLITEYMPGGSLHHLLHVRRLRLPLLHGTNMCLQLTDGVKYLHSQTPRIVHRDLKSQNVVLDLQLNLKLCDFGLTEPMEDTAVAKQNNGGSPRYMAPELFDSLAKITEKVDIWAMGCIFIEVFSRTLPYEGINTLSELTRELMVHKRPPQWPGPLPQALEIVIRSCHNFDHRLRPSARRIFEELRTAKRELREAGIV